MTLTAAVKVLSSVVVRVPLPARYWWPGFCLAFLAAVSLCGGVTFTDNTFNPSDSSTITWKSDARVGISVGQTQSEGNPGQALQVLYSLPPTSGNSMVGLPLASFTYNPAMQGAIQSVDFSVDKKANHK